MSRLFGIGSALAVGLMLATGAGAVLIPADPNSTAPSASPARSPASANSAATRLALVDTAAPLPTTNADNELPKGTLRIGTSIAKPGFAGSGTAHPFQMVSNDTSGPDAKNNKGPADSGQAQNSGAGGNLLPPAPKKSWVDDLFGDPPPKIDTETSINLDTMNWGTGETTTPFSWSIGGSTTPFSWDIHQTGPMFESSLADLIADIELSLDAEFDRQLDDTPSTTDAKPSPGTTPTPEPKPSASTTPAPEPKPSATPAPEPKPSANTTPIPEPKPGTNKTSTSDTTPKPSETGGSNAQPTGASGQIGQSIPGGRLTEAQVSALLDFSGVRDAIYDNSYLALTPAHISTISENVSGLGFRWYSPLDDDVIAPVGDLGGPVENSGGRPIYWQVINNDLLYVLHDVHWPSSSTGGLNEIDSYVPLGLVQISVLSENVAMFGLRWSSAPPPPPPPPPLNDVPLGISTYVPGSYAGLSTPPSGLGVDLAEYINFTSRQTFEAVVNDAVYAENPFDLAVGIHPRFDARLESFTRNMTDDFALSLLWDILHPPASTDIQINVQLVQPDGSPVPSTIPPTFIHVFTPMPGLVFGGQKPLTDFGSSEGPLQSVTNSSSTFTISAGEGAAAYNAAGSGTYYVPFTAPYGFIVPGNGGMTADGLRQQLTLPAGAALQIWPIQIGGDTSFQVGVTTPNYYDQPQAWRNWLNQAILNDCVTDTSFNKLPAPNFDSEKSYPTAIELPETTIRLAARRRLH